MHFLPCGNRADQTAKSSRAIGVCCAMTISMLLTTGVLEEWEVRHMGALRPDLSIAAMIKIQMEPYDTEVMGPSTGNV